jgi:ATP-dependent exoDNAse (exonuclease V) beta subunit/RecB family exonuclease/inactivated superfamily I helicase
VERIFLGWDRPILSAAVDYLHHRYCRSVDWDMAKVLLVLPSSAATRRLGEMLAERAAADRLRLTPPKILTVGALPEQLYQPRLPFADSLVQVLAWAAVLQQADRDFLAPLLVSVPAEDDLETWGRLAQLLSGLHRELATDLLLFTDVVKMLEASPERSRWEVLARLQRQYLDRLHELDLWDIQTARRVAIEKAEPTTERDIVVLGAVDLNHAQRRFLDAVASRVTVLIGAPPQWSDGFDSHGALQSPFWQRLAVPLPDESISICTSAEKIAEEVARQMAQLGDAYTPQQITLGVPDDSLVPLLTDHLKRCGQPARYGPGRPLETSPPVRLLQAVVEYLVANDYASLAKLVRLPAVERWLSQQLQLPADYLQRLDRYYQQTLIVSLQPDAWPVDPQSRTAAADRQLLQQLTEAINQWLRPLRLVRAPIGRWSEPLRRCLQVVYTDVNLDAEDPDSAYLWKSVQGVAAAVTELDAIPESLQVEVDASGALGWVTGQLQKSLVPPPQDPNAIELLGWLDLALDDADVLLLTGLHDGCVPEAVNADPFLPNQLRSRLGLVDNDRRYARDNYILQCLMQSRRHLRVILNQRGLDGDPLIPSRLLLAVPPEQLPARVRSLLEPNDDSDLPRVVGSWRPRPSQSYLPIPRIDQPRIPEYLSPTDFRRYLECPYRFYLSRVLHLEPVSDAETELDPLQFGNLLHDCLATLGDAPVRDCVDAAAIEAWLSSQLESLASERFGPHPSAAVLIQVEQARQRLAAFSMIQAQHAAEGWEILDTERTIGVDAGVGLMVDGVWMPLRGRIDRIDIHRQRRELAILDYKTGAGRGAVAAHWSDSHGWKDLQLPLYRLFAAQLSTEADLTVRLGYIALPKRSEEIRFDWADFPPAQLTSADEAAAAIVRRIRSGEFWPPSRLRNVDRDPFSGLCQSRLARRWRSDQEPAAQLLERQERLDDPLPKAAQWAAEAAAESPAAEPPTTAQTQRIPKALRVRLPSLLPADDYVAPADVPLAWFAPELIRASAGSGKTFQLTIRVLRLLYAGVEPDSLLATTFTRKAAGEILHRILGRLSEAAEQPESLAELLTHLSPMPLDQATCRRLLVRLCGRLHRLRVSTLDSFYSQLAQSFAVELQLPPAWTLVDPSHEGRLQRMAVERMVSRIDRGHLRNLLSMLSKGEVVAGVQREILRVVEQGGAYFDVTRPEDWEKLPVPKGLEPEQLTETLGGIARARLQHKSADQALAKLVLLAESGQWKPIAEHTAVQNAIDGSGTYYRKPLEEPLLGYLVALGRHAAAHELGFVREQTKATYQLLVAYHGEVNQLKHDQRLITFSDIANRLAAWIKRHTQPAPDGSTPDTAERMRQIDWRLDARIEHLLLDEFQDTAPVQWDILLPFARNIFQLAAGSGSFLCVGDTKQAIYGWRGGRAEIFDAVDSQLAGTLQRPLSTSYRSSPVIMEFVNRVFQHLDRHDNFGQGEGIVRRWQRDFPEHRTAVDRTGYVLLRNVAEPPQGETEAAAQELSGELIGELSGEGVESEPMVLATAIEEVIRLSRSAPDCTIGVLARSNAEVARAIYLLREAEVDASQEGGNPLDDSAAVELLLSLLQLADHPGDRVAAFHVRSSPLGPHLLPDPDGCPHRLASQLRASIEVGGYAGGLSTMADQLAPYCDARDQQRLEQLIRLAQRFDRQTPGRIRDFIDTVRRSLVALPVPSQVRVMTIHQAKGLEFDAVFLISLEQKLTGQPGSLVAGYDNPVEPPVAIIRNLPKKLRLFLPERWQQFLEQADQERLSEALCVLYVALTRAKRALYLFTAPHGKTVQCWSSVLQSILDERGHKGEPDCTLYEAGDRQWYRPGDPPALASVAAAGQVAPADSETTPAETAVPPALAPIAPLRIRLRPNAPDSLLRLRPTARPSGEGAHGPLPLVTALRADHSPATLLGSLVHRWLEEFEWIDDPVPSDARLEQCGLETLGPQWLSRVPLSESIATFRQQLAMPSLRQALSRDRYHDWWSSGITRLEVSRERPLLELHQGRLVRGFIDRLVMGLSADGTPLRAEILDYKTDRLSDQEPLESWLERRGEHHAAQLRLYRDVLCQRWGLPTEHVAMTLVMLDQDRLISLPVGE